MDGFHVNHNAILKICGAPTNSIISHCPTKRKIGLSLVRFKIKVTFIYIYLGTVDAQTGMFSWDLIYCLWGPASNKQCNDQVTFIRGGSRISVKRGVRMNMYMYKGIVGSLC